MLLDELLPLLSGLGLRTGPGQVAVLGWSMGAADALRLAQATGARGCHDGRFWQHLAPAQLRFVASVLGASSWPGDRRHRLPVTDVTGRGWLGGPE
jgi:hypothetical protein